MATRIRWTEVLLIGRTAITFVPPIQVADRDRARWSLATAHHVPEDNVVLELDGSGATVLHR